MIVRLLAILCCITICFSQAFSFTDNRQDNRFPNPFTNTNTYTYNPTITYTIGENTYKYTPQSTTTTVNPNTNLFPFAFPNLNPNQQISGGQPINFVRLISYYDNTLIPIYDGIENQATKDFNEWKSRIGRQREVYDFNDVIWDSFQEHAPTIGYRYIIKNNKQMQTYLQNLPTIIQTNQTQHLNAFDKEFADMARKIEADYKKQPTRLPGDISQVSKRIQEKLALYQSRSAAHASQLQKLKSDNINGGKNPQLTPQKIISKARNSSEYLLVNQTIQGLKKKQQQQINFKIITFAEQLRSIYNERTNANIGLEDYLKTPQWNYLGTVYVNATYANVTSSDASLLYYINESAYSNYNRILNMSTYWLNIYNSSRNDFYNLRNQAIDDGKNATSTFNQVLALFDSTPFLTTWFMTNKQIYQANGKYLLERLRLRTASELRADQLVFQAYKRKYGSP